MKKLAFVALAVLCMFGIALAAENTAKAEAQTTFTTVCAACHGIDGAKGLKGKSADFIVKALSGYKAKTFGGPKKAIMEDKAANLSDEQIKALGDYISGL